MEPQQPAEPLTPDYAVEDSRGRTWRRLATTGALAFLLLAVGLFAAMWVIALANGHVQLIPAYYDVAPEFRGNHGPWRQIRILRVIYGYALGVAFFGALPCALLGAAVENSRRAAVVAVLTIILLLIGAAHFPLFD